MSDSSELKNKVRNVSSGGELTWMEYSTQYNADDEDMFKAVRGLLDTCLRLSQEQEIKKDDIIHIKNLVDNFDRQKEKAKGSYNGEYISKFLHNIEYLGEYIEHSIMNGG